MAQIVEQHRGNPRLVTADPLPVVCDAVDCYLVRNGQANFRDTAHISNLNAMQYRDVFDAAFASALRLGADAKKTEKKAD